MEAIAEEGGKEGNRKKLQAEARNEHILQAG